MREPGGAGALPRVLVVAPHYPPEALAGAIRLESLSCELARLGHDVHVVAPGAGAPDAGAGDAADRPRVSRVAVAARGRGVAGNVVHQLRLRRALSREAIRVATTTPGPDVVLCSSPPPVAALAGAAASRRSGRPLVMDFRDLWPTVLVEAGVVREGSPAHWVLERIERRLLAASAAVTTVTNAKVARLRGRSGAPVHLVPNGVDASWCECGPEHAGAAAGPFVVLHAGNIGRAQDVELLARAVIALAASGPARGRAVHALVVGDGEERESVARWARSHPELVRLEPREDRAAIRRRLAACGCAFVSLRTAALADSVPSKMLDAMARGVPVVLAGAGEAAEIVRASKGGLVVEPGDAQALARALEGLAALAPEDRIAMGRRGREHVLSRYRRESAAAEMSRVLVAAASSGGWPR